MNKTEKAEILYNMDQAQITDMYKILNKKNITSALIYERAERTFSNISYHSHLGVDDPEIRKLERFFPAADNYSVVLDFDYVKDEWSSDKVFICRLTKNSYLAVLFKNLRLEQIFGENMELNLKKPKDFKFEFNITNNKFECEHVDSVTTNDNTLIGAILLPFLTEEENKLFNEVLAESYSKERNLERELEVGGNFYRLKCLTFVNMYGDRYLSGIFEDITTQKTLFNKALQAEKLRSLGELAGGIAHDFNNQLMGIMGSIGIIKKRVSDNELDKYIQNIEKAAANSAELIKHLLTFTKTDKNDFRLFDLVKLIDDTCLITKYATTKSVSINKVIAEKKIMINGNSSMIQNMIINLILNAVDAIKNENGMITINAETVYLQETPENTVNHPNFLEGRYAKLVIADDGCGISDSDLKRVFEPFFTTKGSRNGTGLGLSMVLNCVEEHQGILVVKSNIGLGTSFEMYFFLNEPEPVVMSNASSDKQIIIVDDEEIVLMVLQDIMKEIGFEAVSFTDGYKALEYYKNNHQNVCMAILDMMMPNINGYELCRKLKEINKNAKVLILSGYTEDKLEKTLDLEIEGFLMKPIDIKVLESKVMSIVNPNKDVDDFIKGLEVIDKELRDTYIFKLFSYNDANFLYQYFEDKKNQSAALTLVMELRTLFNILKISHFANLAEKLAEKLMLNKEIKEEVSELIIIIQKICTQLPEEND
ncbi:MAG: response regulator [Erysipelotrichales bacterium]|nr:response regulator [Erysipelotrichales bacterium]